MTADSRGFRDQAASAISAILMRLCDSSGALAAALVDGGGETVDYAGRLSPFDTRIAAAEWRLVLGQLQAARVAAFQSTHELLVRAKDSKLRGPGVERRIRARAGVAASRLVRLTPRSGRGRAGSEGRDRVDPALSPGRRHLGASRSQNQRAQTPARSRLARGRMATADARRSSSVPRPGATRGRVPHTLADRYRALASP